jgi:hypothetical protein
VVPQLNALFASTRKVPPFALFEVGASKPAKISWANNAKSGTGVVEASTRLEQLQRLDVPFALSEEHWLSS